MTEKMLLDRQQMSSNTKDLLAAIALAVIFTVLMVAAVLVLDQSLTTCDWSNL